MEVWILFQKILKVIAKYYHYFFLITFFIIIFSHTKKAIIISLFYFCMVVFLGYGIWHYFIAGENLWSIINLLSLEQNEYIYGYVSAIAMVLISGCMIYCFYFFWIYLTRIFNKEAAN